MLRLSPTHTVIRGDSDKFRITFKKQNGNNADATPVNITGWTIRFTVRPVVPSSTVISDTDALISQEAILVDPTHGIALIYVQSSVTTALTPGEYLYDIQVVKPVDEFGFQQVISIRRGKYIVIGDITRNQTAITTNDFQVEYNNNIGNANILNAVYNESNENVSVTNGITVSDILGDASVREIDDADDGYTI